MSGEWYIFHKRRRTPLYVTLYTRGFAYARRRVLRFNYHTNLYYINQSIVMKVSEFEAKRRSVWARLRHDNRFIIKLINDHYLYYRRCGALWREMSRLRVKKLSTRELISWFLKYCDSLSEHWSVGLTPLFIEEDLTQAVKKFLLVKLPATQVQEALRVLTTPQKLGVVGEEYQSLLRLASLRYHTRFEPALKNHWEAYAFMVNPAFEQEFSTLGYYRKRVQVLAQRNPEKLLREFEQERKRVQAQYRYWMRKIKLDMRTRLYIRSLNEAIF